MVKFYSYGDNWQELSTQCKIRAKFKCHRCGRDFSNNKIALHAHHIIPLSKGGRNVLSNLVALCEECHSKEHHKTINTSRFKSKSRHRIHP